VSAARTRRHGVGRHRPRPRRRAITAVLTLGLVSCVGVGWHASYSAFARTAGNSGNGWSTGTVSLTDDMAGVAVFHNLAGLLPGSFGSTCILVTYTGNVATTVELYTRNYAGTIGPYLNLTVQSGTGTSCATFGAATTLFSGTLQALRTSATSFATGLPATGAWAPATSGTAKPYKFSYTLADDNVAQSATASLDLVWEAHST
jgi:hypothetical protein